ncbi:MAG TPA: DNA-directed RNA polymerase subunit D [Candidatus Nanoarchaeia archaeon]|nr:DNA-directed RNA polymerase subunit D [Candidatus Nanoarchaeia archaeon]
MAVIKKTKEKIIFSAETSEGMANAIRRSANEIPILAIDEIEFLKNDSALYDEIIAHRLGLVPLKNEKLADGEKCSCKGKGCGKCTVQLKLSAVGPCTVYSKSLKGAEVVYDKMPIVMLTEGKELELVAKARLGRGVEHAKFSPGLVYYRNKAQIEIGKDCDLCEDCVKACPLKIIKKDKKIIASEEDRYLCDSCEACVEACKKKHDRGHINISPSGEIVFFIESFGQIDAKDILEGAIETLNKNLEQVNKELK